MEEHNVQSQHSKYFLLQESPGERAKILNHAVGLDVIDDLFSYLNEKNLSLNRSLKQTVETKNKIKTNLEEYSNLDDIEIIVNDLKEKSELFKINNTKINKGYDLVQSIKKIRSDIESSKEWLKVESKYTLIRQNIGNWDDLRSTKLKMDKTLQDVKSIGEKLSITNKTLKGEINNYISLLSKNKLCPVCESPITKSIVEKIKENM